MDPCEEFRNLVELEIEARDEARHETLIRAVLGVVGLEFVYDLLTDEGIDWTIFIDLLVAFDLVAAFAWLRGTLKRLGLKGALAKVVARIGPWTLVILGAVIVVEITTVIRRWSAIDLHFTERIVRIYSQSECSDKDRILRELGVEV